GAVFFVAAASACSQSQSATAAGAGASGDAADVLAKAQVSQRLIERTTPAVPGSGQAPHFVVGQGWPNPLPHNWIIGDIGGLYVDRHDTIWVYHRPRALDSTDSGAQGEGGKDDKGRAIRVMGHARPYGCLSGCSIPAPAVLEFDKAGNLLNAWGGPGDPGFLEKRCRQQDGCYWQAREHTLSHQRNYL